MEFMFACTSQCSGTESCLCVCECVCVHTFYIVLLLAVRKLFYYFEAGGRRITHTQRANERIELELVERRKSVSVQVEP